MTHEMHISVADTLHFYIDTQVDEIPAGRRYKWRIEPDEDGVYVATIEWEAKEEVECET